MPRVQLSKKERLIKRRRIRRQLLGLTVLILVCVGIGTIAVGGVNLVKSFVGTGAQAEDFKTLILPVVEIDPPIFSNIGSANPDILREAAIWAALENENKEKYFKEVTDEEGMISLLTVIPAIDVDTYANKLFGPSCRLEHKTFTRKGTGVTYEYQSESNSYIIPPDAESANYYPIIQNITTSRNTKVLLVAYATSTDRNNTDAYYDARFGYLEITDKRLEYVMIKGPNGYYLSAIREPENPAANS